MGLNMRINPSKLKDDEAKQFYLELMLDGKILERMCSEEEKDGSFSVYIDDIQNVSKFCKVWNSDSNCTHCDSKTPNTLIPKCKLY